MAWLETFLLGLGAIFRVLAEGIEKQRREKSLADAQTDADRIAACPADEWVRRFGAGRSETAKADVGKPDADK